MSTYRLATLILSCFAAALLVTACGGGGAGGTDGAGSNSQSGAPGPTSLSYPMNPATYTVGIPITPNVPSVTGTVTAFSIVPSLPAGLMFDPLTGTVSGTPQGELPATGYTVLASNATGFITTTLTITVFPPTVTIDPNLGGSASALHITGLWRGRLVDVYDLDAQGDSSLVAREYVVGENVQAGADYDLVTSAITGVQRLIVQHPRGTPQFQAAFDQLEATLVSIQDVDVADIPPFPLVQRNAVVVVRVDDLLDPATVNLETVKLLVGAQLDVPFEARIFPSSNHGALASHQGSIDFFSTRILIDPTVSQIEAAELQLPVNLLGYPASASTAVLNASLRIPTRLSPAFGQNQILSNLAGNGVSFINNGSNDAQSPTKDIVRAFRTGGPSDVTGDAFNGYLLDVDAPRIVSTQQINITSVQPDPTGGPADYVFEIAFLLPQCGVMPKLGDVLSRAGQFFEITADGPFPQRDGVVGPLPAELVADASGTPTTGLGILQTVFDPASPPLLPACLVRFSPQPGIPPGTDVVPPSQVSVNFSEPMDQESFEAFETMFVTEDPTSSIVVGEVVASSDLTQHTFTPNLPFNHALGTAEQYTLHLEGGADGPTDLAGNPLAAGLPPIQFTLDPSAPSESSRNIVFRFDSADEFGNDGLPELRGQFLHDLQQGLIRPRPVTRYAAVADRTQAVPSIMTPFPQGVQTPLSPLGSKLHSLWRYCDVGMALTDETNMNVDVEGLAWSPLGGVATSDQYSQFEISLSHSKFLPDEDLDPQSLFPKHPNSGLVATYADNVADPVNDPLTVVHPRDLGYSLSPGDIFPSTTGTQMMPYPLNRGIPANEHRYYTWRDTALLVEGGPNGAGADLDIVQTVTGSGQSIYAAGAVRSIGLPLLMEFKCFPDQLALGLNAFDISLAINSSTRPVFRAFATGGINTAGNTVLIDPDVSVMATGGFNPGSNPPGQSTPGTDNSFYVGQADLVVRVSRVHTMWLRTGSLNATLTAPVVSPRPDQQPAGTEVQLAFRAASFVSPALEMDAGALNWYGDPTPPDSVTHLGDGSWSDDPATVGPGALWFQARISFVSNAATLETATLSGLGFAIQN